MESAYRTCFLQYAVQYASRIQNALCGGNTSSASFLYLTLTHCLSLSLPVPKMSLLGILSPGSF